MPDPNYISEIEREDGTVLTIKDAEARAAISDMDPTLQQILQGVNDIKSSIGDVGDIVEEVLVGPPTLIEKTITENGTYDASDDDADGYSSVTVEVSGGGVGGTDVIFYDYDGSVIASYSAADFANLSAMPENPTHAGLTAQGWNWSLADAKTYVASYGKLNIGQMYITSDGKTRLYYVIPKDSLTLDLYLTLEEDTELDVDWGDNSQHTTWASNDGDSSKSHTYSDGGRYTVAITVVSGGFSCKFSGILTDYSLKNVEFGSGVTSIGSEAFTGCYALTSITIPSSVTSIGYEAFVNCKTLRSITIPNGATSIEYETFAYCNALTSITIPNGVTSIEDSAFNSCQALTSITIPNGVTSIEDSAFAYCYALKSITVPSSVTSIGIETFAYCNALTSITIPNGVTSISSYTFYYCYALKSITIPNGVTSIGNDAFSECYALSSITFEPTTPPELDGDMGIPKTCIIRVPQGSLSAYTSASNYPDPSQYIYEEY